MITRAEPGWIAQTETPEYVGLIRTVTVIVPENEVGEVNKNDTNRRELAAKIEAALLLLDQQENP
jgi:hypothetical protein